MEQPTYKVKTTKPFAEAITSVLREIEVKNWTVFSIYDVQERLAAKNFPIEPLKIIEICSAKHASKLLSQNKDISLCMPCKINVVQENGEVFLCTILPSTIGVFFNGAEHVDLMAVESDLKEIIAKAR